MPDIAASISTSAVITVGTALTSTIDTFGDHDWYRVELEAGHTYSFALDGTILQGGSALDDPELTLRDAAGGWIVTNDDVEGGVLRNSMIRFTAVTSGTYYLDAGGFIDGYTGDFRITAFDVGATASLDQIATYLQIGYAGFAYEQPYQLVGSTFTYNLQMLSAAERTLAHLALQSWDDVGAFTFVETSGAATITFENWGSGFAESFGNSTSATVHISIDWYYGDLSINGYMYQTYVHEIGHALGLGHTGPYNGGAIYGLDNLFANDSVAASIMSYFTPTEAGVGTDETVMGPQMADIVAIGNLYGLSTSTRTGDTVYGFNSNAGQIYNLSDPIYATEPPAFTIYDNGGIDSLDASGYAQSQRIDLNAETWSDIGGKINNIAVARGVVVENAFGGSGADTIIGNSADNSIYGNAGVDHVYGNGGADVMFAGAGHDTLYGGDGADSLVGNDDIFAQEADTLDGGADNDTLYGEFTDTIIGGTGTDVLYAVNSFDWNINLGATGVEWMLAGFGNDTINGSTQTASVEIYGSGGNDNITGSSQADMLWAGVGDDVVSGGDGDDMLFGDLGADSLSGGGGNDRLYVDSTDSLIDGGTGVDAVYITSGPGMTFNMQTSNIEFVIDFAGGSDTLNGADLIVDMTAFTGGGADIITGGSGNDFLWGEADGDTITGNDGGDVLVGGIGADVMTGGTGIDVVYMNSGGGSDGALDRAVFGAGFGTDFVFDFIVGEDRLDLTALGTSFGALSITNSFGHAHIQIDAGPDLIVVANNGGLLTEGDFLF